MKRDTQHPKISVITPTYNRHDLLPRAIESVLAQTFQDWEMIIVDDCPEHPAEDIVVHYDDKRIRYICHEKNSGGAIARNTAMSASLGEYFCFIDDDDEWPPYALSTLYDAVRNTPREVGFVFGAVENVYPDGKIEISTVPEGIADYHERALSKFNGFIGQTLIVKREVYETVGGWDPIYPSHQEIEWIIRITKEYKGLGLNKPLVRIFMEGGHVRIGNQVRKRIMGREMILEKHKEEFLARPKVLARHLFQLGLWYRQSGDTATAMRRIGRAFYLDPSLRYFGHYSLLFAKVYSARARASILRYITPNKRST